MAELLPADLQCGHTKLYIDSFMGPEQITPCLWCERDQLRAENERLKKALPWRDGCNCEGCARMRARYAMHATASAHPRSGDPR